VTATNDADRTKTQTVTADGRGVGLLDGKSLGLGAVTVTAALGNLSSSPGRFTFFPSECAGSLVEPRDLRLQLRP
jgi:hypothetical protein